MYNAKTGLTVRVLALALCLCAVFGQLGGAAFADGTLTLPKKLKTIEAYAFYGDKALDAVVIPNGTKTIGDYAFANSSVTTIRIPDSVKSIGANAFKGTRVTIQASAGSYAQKYAAGKGLAWRDTAPVLPEPGAFFRNRVSFKTEDWNLLHYGMIASASFQYTDLKLAREYTSCIEKNYPFTLAKYVKTGNGGYNESWDFYSESYFFRYDGSAALGGVYVPQLDEVYRDKYPVCVNLDIYPGGNQVVFSIYYDNGVSFRDDGYRSAKAPSTPDPAPSPGGGDFCYTCGNTRRVECGNCHGRGQIQEYVTHTIFGKQERVLEWVDCPRCSLGYIPCPSCS